MFSHNNKKNKMSYAEKSEQHQRNKIAKERGKVLRHLAYWASDDMQQGKTVAMINSYGHDPLVINAQGQMLYSPIFKSVSIGHQRITHALMRAPGLNVNLRDMYGLNILMFALQEWKPDHELIQYLLQRKDLDFTAKTYVKRSTIFSGEMREKHKCRGASALYFATASTECYQYIPALLDLVGDEVNDYVEYKEYGRPKEMRSPLTNLVTALANGKGDRKLLLSCVTRMASTLSINIGDVPKAQPRDEALYIAAKAGDREVVKILLDAGATNLYRDAQGESASSAALYCGHAELSMCILQYIPRARLPEELPGYVASPLEASHPEASVPPLEASHPGASAPPLNELEDQDEQKNSPHM